MYVRLRREETMVPVLMLFVIMLATIVTNKFVLGFIAWVLWVAAYVTFGAFKD